MTASHKDMPKVAARTAPTRLEAMIEALFRPQKVFSRKARGFTWWRRFGAMIQGPTSGQLVRP
jgi:hypothetical protein